MVQVRIFTEIHLNLLILFRQFSRNDMQIVEYLVEIIKMKQIHDNPSTTGLSEPPPVIQLDYSPVRTFRNSKK